MKIRDVAPMLYRKEVVHDSAGNNTDNYVTDPIQVDRVARQAWNPIYAGNVKGIKQHCRDFLGKYGNDKGKSYIYQPKEATEVKDIDPDELYQLFVHRKHNSGGLDGWTPEDVTLISKSACALICTMLNNIEMGTMQWPKLVLTARAAFMANDPTKLEDPLKYRVFTVLPVVYRKWASLRF